MALEADEPGEQITYIPDLWILHPENGKIKSPYLIGLSPKLNERVNGKHLVPNPTHSKIGSVLYVLAFANIFKRHKQEDMAVRSRA